ncbi:MAG: threonine/serine dehydratase [Pseudomonadota bacterium]
MAAPSLDEVRALRADLGTRIQRTPVLACEPLSAAMGGETSVIAKLEFLQRTGTFKARGALASVQQLSPDERARGVTAVSAGNHAIAVAYAARSYEIAAKVVMTRSANAARVDRCRALGAEIVIADDVHSAFDEVRRIESEEGMAFIHPFEGPHIVRGTATLGLEFMEQAPALDVVVVPIGGGGLCAGVAAAVKQFDASMHVVGVEPVGADTMHRSFASGVPESIDSVQTIADSLGAPHAMPETFGLCREYVDRLVSVTDDELREAMYFLFSRMRIAVEPACAATAAAVLGPLRDDLNGKRVGIVMCGSNIDWETFATHAL